MPGPSNETEDGMTTAIDSIAPRRSSPALGATRFIRNFLNAAAAFAVVAAVAGGGWRLRRFLPNESLLSQLVDATAVLASRPIEARLSGGFRWAPHDSISSALPVRAAAASVLHASRTDESSDGRRAAAAAYLLLDRASDAADLLDPAGPKLADARVWSDLAAANYQVAIRTSHPQSLGKALAAADAALRIDSKLPEALFNRALVLERYGLRDLAREAWEKYVTVDPTGSWSDEARQRVDALREEPRFRDILAKEYDKLATDAAFAHSFARQYPQQARTWGETEILGRWATAEVTADHDAADKHLRIAREFGAELVRYRGDRMLAAAVEAIDRTTAAQRSTLARGHIAFRDAQKVYGTNKPSVAHGLFVDAAADFERGGSPVALLARYFMTNTTYDAGRTEEANAARERYLATAPPEFPAYRAQLQWEIGRAYALDGRFGEALEMLATSAENFDRLGERNYAATVREIRAEFLDRIGRMNEAWRERMLALRELGRQLSPRLLIAISSMSRAALIDEEWQQAASFLDIELEVCRRTATPMRWVEMLLRRAQLRNSIGDRFGARADVRQARAEIVRLNDPASSSLMEQEAMVVDAMLADSPAQSIQMLTTAIDTFEPRGRRVFRPEALLLRGRAYNTMGDRARAAADFETGIAELEAGRESLPHGAIRWGMLEVGQDLFEEAISLALTQARAATAFSYAERGRARELRDILGVGSSAIRTDDLPEEMVIVEYVVLRDRLVLFVVDRSGVRVGEKAISRRDVRDGVMRFSAASDKTQFNSASAALYQLLIEPVASELSAHKRLVFIPDSTLSGVAFAALSDDSGGYLIERHEVVVCPSAAVFQRLSKQVPAQTEQRLLIVANPERNGSEVDLVLAEREAAVIARMYHRPTLLERENATVAAFTREAPLATVIHFAGHAVAGSGGGALLLAKRHDEEGYVDAATIARMRLNRTAVVILAACDTAIGDVEGNEGPISITRSFLAAGVPSVVAALRPIDDREAALFFPRVHEALARGDDPATALCAAQRESIRRGDISIATWAAVQVIGR
jgi:CHAT domain-containing protein/tetratricopeptide (TPR) repeat protein